MNFKNLKLTCETQHWEDEYSRDHYNYKWYLEYGKKKQLIQDSQHSELSNYLKPFEVTEFLNIKYDSAFLKKMWKENPDFFHCLKLSNVEKDLVLSPLVKKKIQKLEDSLKLLALAQHDVLDQLKKLRKK